MRPGDLIVAKYRLERVIGSGTMGEVWAAINESTGGPVAIKLIGSPTRQLRSGMRREAGGGGSLNPGNVVAVYDVGEPTAGVLFLVRQLLPGESLADRLKRVGGLPPAEAADIACSIAR